MSDNIVFERAGVEAHAGTSELNMHQPLDVTGRGVVAMAEVKHETVLIPEISPERRETYKAFDPSVTYLVECSDDRELTPESEAALIEAHGITPDNYIRIFGGLPGMARRVLVTLAAHSGPEVLMSYAQSDRPFNGFLKELKDRVESNADVVMAAHSAEKNEGNPTNLNMDSEQGLGCAYCQGICVVGGYCAENGNLAKLAAEEVPASLGEPAQMDVITQANDAIGELFFKDEQPVTRRDMADLGIAVAILKGDHAPADDIEVVLNFTDEVSSPKAANDANVPLYSVDVVHELLLAKKAFPELFNNEAILRTYMHVIEHDARAVREALANHEGKTAANMHLARNGKPDSAIAYVLAA